MSKSSSPFPVAAKNVHTVTGDRFVIYGGSATNQDKDQFDIHLETSSSNDGRESEGVSTLSKPNGNIYNERFGHNIDLATNELILRNVPDDAILVRVNNKVPGLGLQLDASELNLVYKDKYNVEVPDSYEHLLLDVIDGDNHLFMRSDELTAAWNILNPVL
ncbi:hypothetical protein KPL71_017241 [Citrus sinensis]|uniref:Uncharacterized protein n=1 Tax=Citrus sinensis TaxID=2711 RepID=A0ACB8JMQ0_CITSI|nr:hypothetical protein KPL71_017241 [Citrus sinensis]